ncbi:amidohydrolase family protein [Noviherbaspirillum sedimenti]|uniref:Amidohydrolase n=1 Tax=Noviherbaspirillum sedimenti TaxID=2320865 RepID=A0A3A3G6I5_9BURK|nr:amidohydrolase family protein [Noviherbaspirillum sedimenti]RJG03265.1 amidohydrolase [Noviherbaspirillum sedimenti]
MSKSTAAPMRENIVMPDLPIVDAHIHLWDRIGFDYFAPEFLVDVADGHNVTASIYVECNMRYSDDPRPDFQPIGETEFVLEQAKLAEGSGHDLACGILGAVNLPLGADVEPIIDAQIAAGQGRFRGVRFRVAFDTDPVAGYNEIGYPSGSVLDNPAFLDAARCLARKGLVLDLWAFHTQLDDVLRFAEKVPELTIVLDHVGGPLGVGRYASMRKEVFGHWSRGIGSLATAPNVNVKLSGLGISRLGFNFAGGGQAQSSDELVAAWKPYVRTCVEAFGPERSIFGSNFPVDRAAASYRTLLNGFKKMLADIGDVELRAVFAENARRVYRLP